MFVRGDYTMCHKVTDTHFIRCVSFIKKFFLTFLLTCLVALHTTNAYSCDEDYLGLLGDVHHEITSNNSKKELCDIAIAGAGISGLSTALELVKKGVTPDHITIISPEVANSSDIRAGATNAAGAMLAATSEINHWMLRPASSKNEVVEFSSEADKLLYELSLEAVRAWPDYLKELKSLAPPEYTDFPEITTGIWVILNTVGSSLDSLNFDAILELAEKYKVEHKHVTRHREIEKIPGLNPRLDNERPTQAIYIKEEGSIDPRLVLKLLKAILLSKGVNFVNDEVSSVLVSDGKAIGLQGREQKYHAGQVLLAAGAFTEPIVRNTKEIASFVQPILGGLGYSYMVDQPVAEEGVDNTKTTIRTPNRGGNCGLNVVLGKSKIYVGATNNIVFISPEVGPSKPKPRCSQEQIALLQETSRQCSELLYTKARVQEFQGMRPVSLDTFPLVGAVNNVEGVFISTAGYRIGFTLAPMLATNVANAMMGISDPSCKVFRPDRSLIKTVYTIERAKEVAFECMKAGMYERKMADSTAARVLPSLELMWKDSIERLFAEIKFPLHPSLTPMVLASYELTSDVQNIKRLAAAVLHFSCLKEKGEGAEAEGSDD